MSFMRFSDHLLFYLYYVLILNTCMNTIGVTKYKLIDTELTVASIEIVSKCIQIHEAYKCINFLVKSLYL